MAGKIFQNQPYQEYQIPITSTASSALLLAFPNGGAGFNRVEMEARGDACVIKFGNSTVAASATLTSLALPVGNFSLASYDTYECDIDSRSQNYVSIISDDGMTISGAVLVLRVCAVNL